MGYGVRGLASPHPFLGATRCAVRIVLRLWTSLLFCSSSSCIPTRTWSRLSFRSSTECSNFQLCFRGVYAQCKLCKSWSFHRAVLRRCLRALCCALTGAGDGPDSAEIRKVSVRVLGQGCLVRCDARQEVVQTVQKTVKIPHAFLDMVVDRCWMVETVQKTVESPQLVLPLSVSVYGCLSSGDCFSDSWTTSNSGDGDGDLAASSFSVSCVQGSVAQGFVPTKCSGFSSVSVQ